MNGKVLSIFVKNKRFTKNRRRLVLIQGGLKGAPIMLCAHQRVFQDQES